MRTLYAGPWTNGVVRPVPMDEDAERLLLEDFDAWRHSLPAGSGDVVDFEIKAGVPVSRPWEKVAIWTCHVEVAA